MAGFFLERGSPEWNARKAELAEREARHDAAIDARVAEVEAMLADDSREGLRLVELAQLLGLDDFQRREQGLAFAASLRSSPRANDPDYQRVIMIHERNGRLNVEGPLRKARQIMALVRSWGD